jgi:hypothetical protein
MNSEIINHVYKLSIFKKKSLIDPPKFKESRDNYRRLALITSFMEKIRLQQRQPSSLKINQKKDKGVQRLKLFTKGYRYHPYGEKYWYTS